MKKNLLVLASGAAALLLVTGCATKHVAPAPAPAPVKSYIVKGVNFAFDSDRLTPAGEAVVAEAAAGIKASAPQVYNVVGHTDSIGSDAYNMDLSQRRANTVTNMLVSKGVSSSQLRTSWMGKRQPIASNDTDEGRAENRRVEINPVR